MKKQIRVKAKVKKRMEKEMRLISLFSGAGGLDLGFENAGFKIVFANDCDRDVWETFEKNHGIKINRSSITDIKSDEIPSATGIVGGPPCQSWSLAGEMRGINDKRGQLFYEYLRIIQDKKPLFFLAENVAGLVSSAHKAEFDKIVKRFEELGYNVNWKLLNAKDFGVPQERKRVIVIGYRKDLNKKFNFDALKKQNIISLKEAIGNLPESIPAKDKTKPNDNLKISNHEHMTGDFSTMFMSRNRRKGWEESSFTIQAGGRHAPLHPNSAEMVKKSSDEWEFKEDRVRRMSVRECARIQTFPDNFKFYYNNVAKGYKMIGNAVPIKFAEAIAEQIKKDIIESKK
jgi:DNA (cytosine-5)-methyltransferase 1